MGCICTKSNKQINKLNIKPSEKYVDPNKNSDNLIEIINNSQNVAENLKHDTPNMSKNHQIKSPFPHKGDESPKIIEIEKSSLINNPENDNYKEIHQNIIESPYKIQDPIIYKSNIDIPKQNNSNLNNYQSINLTEPKDVKIKILSEKKPSYIFMDKVENEKTNEDDIYFELTDNEILEYQEYMNLAKNLDPIKNNKFSTFNDWTKTIQKASMPSEKLSESMMKQNTDTILDVFKSILSLRERNWYEEVLQLYKEKNSAKFSQTMFAMNFDRKLIHIQEHFKWFISSIAHFAFNFNAILGSTNFPLLFSDVKTKAKSNSNNSASFNPALLKSNSISEVMEMDDVKSFTKSSKSLLFNSNAFDLRKPESLNLENEKSFFQIYLPQSTSPKWFEGFYWRGVFLKMYSKKDAKKIKSELKMLKNLAIEYLQSESTFKLDNQSKDKMSESYIEIKNIKNIENSANYKYINFILPLICYVESSSWILLGTPYIYNKRNEDHKIRNLNDYFQQSLFLSSLNQKNLKYHYKMYEESSTILLTPNSSATLSVTNTLNVIITNVFNILPKQANTCLMYVINQDHNTNVVYFDPPEKGELEINSIKQLLGYSQLNIGYYNLCNNKENNDYFDIWFEIVNFEYFNWKFQMIYINFKNSKQNQFFINERATELVKYGNSNKNKNIYGNVLVLAINENNYSNISPNFINEIETFNYFKEKNSIKGSFEIRKNKIFNSEIKNSLFQKKDEKEKNNYEKNLIIQLIQGIKEIVKKLEFSDEINNPFALKELFHRYGVNMRFEWVVYCKLKNSKSKGIVASDILIRTLKKKINFLIDKKIKEINSKKNPDSFEKNEIMGEIYFKTLLMKFLSLLIIGESKKIEENSFYNEVMLELNLSLLRILNYTNKILFENELYILLSSQLLKEIMTVPFNEGNIFIDFFQQHFNITLNYDLIKLLRTDKYYFLISKNVNFLQAKEILSINYKTYSYLTFKERAYLILIKQNLNKSPKYSHEIIIPSVFYRTNLLNVLETNSQMNYKSNLFDQLRSKYYLPDNDVLNDWTLCLEILVNGLQCIEGDHNVILEAYILTILQSYFLEQDEEQCKLILEKFVNYLNGSLICQPEIIIIVHTLLGILSETKSLLECEQNYMMALLVLHKLYGDPRGRGAIGIPWELFLTWRISIVTRLQNKIHDAEYVEELFDATMLNLKANKYNWFLHQHYIYDEPFKPYDNSFNSNKYLYTPTKIKTKRSSSKENFNKSISPNIILKSSNKNIKSECQIPDFITHWTKHLNYDESTSKIDVLSQSLPKNEEIFKWLLQNSLIFNQTKIIWQTSFLKSFFLSIMQSVYTSNSTVSSLSNYSLRPDRQQSKDSINKSPNNFNEGFPNSSATPKNIKQSKKNKNLNQSGNLVQVFEKDSSTFSKKDASGIAFVWGQNVEGQLGIVFDGEDENNSNLKFNKKLKVINPKLLLPLKNTIIRSVACGYTHTVAITLNHHVLAWGNNKSNQLGLGPDSPSNVTIPTQIPKLEMIIQVSCGHEHTIGLDSHGNVFSWGQGEGGLLGHGDLKMQNSPKMIEGLRNILIESITCGGLHTLALTKNNCIYCWGRGEGGQLGLPFNLLTNEEGELYLTSPKRIRTLPEGSIIKQIACGDAHSLVLLNNGKVYGWGYTNSGQLGLGITGDTLEGNPHFNTIQIREPILIESLNTLNITKIFAGSTFSMFVTDKKELYACGLNDYNQLGFEKIPLKSLTTVLDNYRNPSVSTNVFSECSIPKKLDFFQQIPILHVACGENHTIAMTLYESKYYTLFSWGMHKHNQLGLGEIGLNSSTPKPINYLQDIVFYNMGCGAYHSIALAGFPISSLDSESLMIKKIEKYDSKWNFSYYDMKDNYSNVLEFAFSNLENITPSDEGKIDNPKSIKTVN